MPHPTHPRRRTGLLLVLPLVLALAASLVLPARAQPTADDDDVVVIEVLGNRADLLSDGNALVQVTIPDGSSPEDLQVTLGTPPATEGDASATVGVDVTDAFAVRPDGRYMGLVDRLPLGESVLTATLPDGSGARLTLTNHPRGGPVFSGPQIQPWTCDEGALDDQCNRETEFSFLYMPRDRSGFRSYDPDNPPSDVATTTTTEGEEVPYIVRREDGVMNRDHYAIAVLFDPEAPFEPWAPQPGWNGRMVITHGQSCDTGYAQLAAREVMVDGLLSNGFAVMNHSLNHSGHACNVVLQAESMIMVKEHFTENYGEIRWTIGTGCSGGALAQYWTANAYPGGIYDGITASCSFPDAGSSAMQYVDYDLLRTYFEQPDRWGSLPDGNPIVWTPELQEAVYGHPNAINAVTFTEVIPNSGDPSRNQNVAANLGPQRCPGLPDDQLYDADTNPDGVRCTLQDYNVNALGTDPTTGHAHRPFSNVGIQYGLQGLLDGTLSPAEFVDLNTKVGGWDGDYERQDQRYDGPTQGFVNIYRTGLNNTAANLDTVAIIDNRGPDPGAFHDTYRTYALQERLVREHGTADNMLLWRGPTPLLGDATFTNESVLAVDRWLAAVDADDSNLGLDEKLIRNRPEDVTDRCTNGSGVDVPEDFCDGVIDVYSTPRIAAGAPTTDDVQRCRLVPLADFDYGDVGFTDAQRAALAQAFPGGVCDWSKPSVGDTDTVPWLDYSTRQGGVAMGPAPVSVPFGPGMAVIAQVDRIAGDNRIETAVASSRASFGAADTVVIASSADFADALAGAPLAAFEDAPVLLVGPTVLPPQTVAEIRRLGATRAAVLGGDAAVSDAVVVGLADLGLDVERVAGATRVETSMAVARRIGTDRGLILASRDSFLGALAASGHAAAQQVPILLIDPIDLGPVSELVEAGAEVTIVGSTATISASVAEQVADLGGDARRLDSDRPGVLSAAFASLAAEAGRSTTTLWLATSRDYPDGLVAGAAAGRTGAPLLLVDGQDVQATPETLELLRSLAGSVEQVHISGGVAAVSPAVAAAVEAALEG